MSRFRHLNIPGIVIGIMLTLAGAYLLFEAPVRFAQYDYRTSPRRSHRTAVTNVEPFENRILGILGISIGLAIVYFSSKKLD